MDVRGLIAGGVLALQSDDDARTAAQIRERGRAVLAGPVLRVHLYGDVGVCCRRGQDKRADHARCDKKTSQNTHESVSSQVLR